MSSSRPDARGSFPARIAGAWQVLSSEQRLAAGAASALFLTLFLPWYRVQVVDLHLARGASELSPAQVYSGWDAFSWVEAAVLLVAISVLVLLFQRAEGRAFHLPGGDGRVLTVAGGWTCFLVIWRMFDKQGVSRRGQIALSSGIEWGIFVALLFAGVLTYAGTRIRATRQPEPPLPTEGYAVFDGEWHEPSGAPRTPASVRARRGGPNAAAADAVRAPASGAPASTSRRRSSWRPAERPDWSEERRPVGWLLAPPTRRTGEAPDPADVGRDDGDGAAPEPDPRERTTRLEHGGQAP
jgi:hypothetical protein